MEAKFTEYRRIAQEIDKNVKDFKVQEDVKRKELKNCLRAMR